MCIRGSSLLIYLASSSSLPMVLETCNLYMYNILKITYCLFLHNVCLVPHNSLQNKSFLVLGITRGVIVCLLHGNQSSPSPNNYRRTLTMELAAANRSSPLPSIEIFFYSSTFFPLQCIQTLQVEFHRPTWLAREQARGQIFA